MFFLQGSLTNMKTICHCGFAHIYEWNNENFIFCAAKLSVANYFYNTLYLRCFIGLWIRDELDLIFLVGLYEINQSTNQPT